MAATFQKRLSALHDKLVEFLSTIDVHDDIDTDDETSTTSERLGELMEKATIYNKWGLVLTNHIENVNKLDDYYVQYTLGRTSANKIEAAVAAYDTFSSATCTYIETVSRAEEVQSEIKCKLKEIDTFINIVKSKATAELHQRSYDQSDDSDDDDDQENRNSNDTVHLPRLTIEKYDGSIDKFMEFMETFTSTVDSQDMSRIEKFRYLKSYLVGRPLALLSGMDVTGEIYEQAMELLTKEYGNPELIATALYDKLVNLQSKSSHPEDVRDMLQICEGILRQLTTMNHCVDNPCGRTLVMGLLQAKVPKYLRLDMDNHRPFEKRKLEWKPFEFCDTLREVLNQIDKQNHIDNVKNLQLDLMKNTDQNDNHDWRQITSTNGEGLSNNPNFETVDHYQPYRENVATTEVIPFQLKRNNQMKRQFNSKSKRIKRTRNCFNNRMQHHPRAPHHIYRNDIRSSSVIMMTALADIQGP